MNVNVIKFQTDVALLNIGFNLKIYNDITDITL